ncbi:hypothetical protein ALC53_09188 [Atta colombica]|uniref:Uncharacterized protein n=1 Tax=Atta colombica TaxID=520822 RepID=A0A195B7B9_9HYME|nr:hypothetical protein ALC53_09188 [Atta colombica]
MEEKEEKEEEQEEKEEAATIPRLHYTTTVSPQTTLREGEEREMGSTDQKTDRPIRQDPLAPLALPAPLLTLLLTASNLRMNTLAIAVQQMATAMITIELGIRQMRNFNYSMWPVGNVKKNGNETRKVLMLSLQTDRFMNPCICVCMYVYRVMRI